MELSFTKMIKLNLPKLILICLLGLINPLSIFSQQEFCDETCTPVCPADENNTLSVGCSFFSVDIAEVLVTELSQNGDPIPLTISCTTPFINNIRGDGEFEFLSCSDSGALEGGSTIEEIIGSTICGIVDGISIDLPLGIGEISILPNLLPEGEFCQEMRELQCDDSVLGLLLAGLQTQFDGMNGGVTFFADTDGDGTFDFQRNQGNNPTLPGFITDNIPNNVVGAGCITIRIVATFPRPPADFCGELAPEISLIDIIAPAFEAIPIAGPIIPSLLRSNDCDSNLSFFDAEDFNIIVENNQPPTFVNCPTTDFVFTGGCGSGVNWSIPIAVDDCSGELLIFRGMGAPVPGTPGIWQTSGPAPGTILAPGTYPVSYTAQGCDLPSTCNFNVVVVPEPQMLVCAPSITVPTDVDGCTSTVVGLEPLTGMGCTSRLSYSITGVTTASETATSNGQLLVPNGTVFNCGTSTVMYTLESDINLDGDFSDIVNGFPETQTCSFTVTVEDNQIPTTVCQDLEVQLGIDGTVTINAEDGSDGLQFVDGGSLDNCSAQSDLIYAISANGDVGESLTFTCANQGVNSVMLSVSDIDCVTGAANNTMTCLSQVNVLNYFDGWNVTLDVPEVCFENTNTTVNFSEYLTIQDPAGNIFTHADILSNPDFNGVFSIVGAASLNGSYAGSASPDGVFTSNLADAFANVTVEYRLSLSASAGCFINGRDIFEIRRPMDVSNAHCNCPVSENLREVNLGDLFGVADGNGGFFPVGEGPYTIQYTGGILTDGMGNILDLNDNGTIIYDYAYLPGTVVDQFGAYWGSGNMLDDDHTPDDLQDNPVIGGLLSAENNSSTVFPLIGGTGTTPTGGAFDLGSIVFADLGADGILNTIDDVPLDGQWSFTIIDGRGCEVFRSGECTKLETEIHGPSGPVCMDDPVIEYFDARTQPTLSTIPFGFPACETTAGGANFDPSWEFYENTFNGPAILDAAVIPGGILAPNLGTDPIPDNTATSILSVVAGQGTVQLNPDALEAMYPQGGQFLIRMYVDRHQCHDPLNLQDEAACLEIFETQVLIYPSFDACWDMPLEICGNAPPVRIDVNEFEPGYDALAPFYDLDEISIWDLIAPNGTIIGTGTSGMLWLEDDVDPLGRFILEGLSDGDVRFYPQVLFENFGPGTYTLNHELGIENCRASCTVVFDILPVPEVATSTTMPNVCCEDDIVLIVDSLFSGTQVYEYQWTEATTGYVGPLVNFPTIPLFQDTLLPADTLMFPVASLPGGCPAEGVFDFVLTVTDSKGCQIRDTLEVAINPNPNLDPEVINSVFCQTNSFQGISPIKNTAFGTTVLTVDCGMDVDGDGFIETGSCGGVTVVGDRDGDGIPDVADADLNTLDLDGDGIPNSADADIDGDGIGNIADPDVNGDLIFENGPDLDGNNIADACDVNFTPGIDSNGNGILDSCENDMDGDGIIDSCDAGGFDADGDGILDNIDADIQGNDTDGDGITDVADSDVDGDGIPNSADADFTGSDNDNDGINDAADVDDDNDGIFDAADHNPIFAFDHTDADNDEINSAADVDATGGVDANGNGIDDAFAAANLNDANGDGIDDTIFLQDDLNEDGIIDGFINPNDGDSDDVVDICDVDIDNDGINDACDIDQNPGAGDADGDGIIDACDVLVYPDPTSKWFASETSDVPLYDFDSDKDGINDSDLDNDDSTFDPVHAGLVDSNVPGEYTFWVECFCIPGMKCASNRVPVTITILDCQLYSDECTYFLVLQDFGGDGWEGASIDVLVDEVQPATNYKLTSEDCDLKIIPISTFDGGQIDLTYWAASKENEHSWFVATPDGEIAPDINDDPVFFGAFPPTTQVNVKLDCPANCEEVEDYYIVNTIGDAAAGQLWELRGADGEIIVANAFGDYDGLAEGTVVIDTVELSSCADFTFSIFDATGNIWENATWQIVGSDADRGILLTEGAFSGSYEIISGPVGSFSSEQICAFNIPCKPEECPGDETILTTNTTDCELAAFVHPNPPTPFICYPSSYVDAPIPSLTISYPDLGVDRVDISTAVDLPVGTNPVVFEFTYFDGQLVRCSSEVFVVTDNNPIFACNDNLNLSLITATLTSTDDCFRTITPDELIESPLSCEGQYNVIIFDVAGQRLSPPNVVGPDQVGLTLSYKVEHIGLSGVECWGSLTVEDKIAPLIECTDYEIPCTHPSLMDEKFSRTESFFGSELPAQIGAQGSNVVSIVQVDCAPMGEFIQNISLNLVHSHNRPSDLIATITSPSGKSTTTTIPSNGNGSTSFEVEPANSDLNAFDGDTFDSVEGQWEVTITDTNGQQVNGDLGGLGTISEISLNITSGFLDPVLVMDCSEVIFSVISEVIEETNCDQSDWLGAKLIRTWQAIDASGNAANCEQVIGLRAPRLMDQELPGEEKYFECGEVPTDPALLSPEISGSPSFDCFTLMDSQAGICDISVAFDDVVLDVCGNSFTIIRTWSITNWCSNTTLTHQQLIHVEDNNGPLVDSANIQYGTGPNACATGAVFLSPAVSDLCSDVESIIATYSIGGGAYDNEGVLTITDITNGEALSDLSLGFTEIEIVATDACGNVTRELVSVNTIDPVNPIAICNDGLNISLNNDGTGVLLASDLDEGSNDNCGIALIEARRVGGCLDTTAWSSTIPFECCDVDQNITVELRVTDNAGNSNVCWSTVLVEDTTSPTIDCSDDVTLTCDEALHADDVFFAPDANDNCGATVEAGDIITQDLPMCGQILTQTWTATDGSDKTDDASCTQTITITHVSDFIVQFPADQEFENCELGDINGPIVTDDECENIGISVEDRIFVQVDDACYSIERTYTIINHCIVDDPSVGGFTNLGTPLPIPNTFRDDDGFFQFTQIIKVQDNVAPTVDFTAPEPCDFTGGCEGELILIATGEDDCAEFADLDFSWKIDAFSDGTFELEGTGDDASGTYPYGDHIIKWTVTDGCGNATSEEYPFSIMDCKNPTPVCQGVTTVVMNNGECVSIWALNLLEYAEDNCTERTVEEWDDNARIRREGDNGALTTSLDICCDDVANGGVNVEVWIEDEAGNSDFCVVFLEIQDNGSNCPDTGNGAAARISGTTATEFNTMVEDVEVAINSKTIMTNTSGVYTSFENSYNTYVVTPQKLDNAAEGISTFDLVLLAQHILKINDLDTPYQLIAADVNDDNQVDVFDMLELRELILFNITNFSNNTSWRFVDKEYTFQNPLAPWVEDYPQSITVDLQEENKMDEDFIAVKIGDLDGSAKRNLVGSLEERSFPETLMFHIDDIELKKGNEYAVDFRASDFTDITGYQFTLQFDNSAVDFTSVDAGVLDIDRSNFGLAMLKEGILTTSFAEMGDALNIIDNEVLFTINFMAMANISLEDVLSLTDKYAVAEAYNVENEVSGIGLSFQNAELLTIPTVEFELFQNTPNPFSESSKIGFNLPEATEGTIVVYDLTGKLVWSIFDRFERGFNEIVLDRSTIKVSGTLFYQFKSANYNAGRKMIVVD